MSSSDEDQEEVTPGISVVDPEESNQTEEAQEESDAFAAWLKVNRSMKPPVFSTFDVPASLRSHYARADQTPIACENSGHYRKVKRNRKKMRKKFAKTVRSPKKLRAYQRRNLITTSRRNPMFPAYGGRSCFDPKLIAMNTPGYRVPKHAISRKNLHGFRLVKESASKVSEELADRFPKTKPASKLTESGPLDWIPKRKDVVPFNQEARRSGPIQWSKVYIERGGKTGAVYTEKNIFEFTSQAQPGHIDTWPRELESMATRHHDKGAFDNSKRWDSNLLGSHLHEEYVSSGQTPGPKFLHPGVSVVQPKISHFGKKMCPRVLFSHKKTLGAVHSAGGHSPGPCALYDPLRSLTVTRHKATKSSFGAGFDETRKVKMRKIPLGHSLKDAFLSVPRSPGLPVRTDKELESTGREQFIGKLAEDNNEIPKITKRASANGNENEGSDSDDDEDSEEAKAARDKAMLEAQRAKLRELMGN